MATKKILVSNSTSTSGSVNFLVEDAKSAAIRYVVKQGSAQAGSSGYSTRNQGSFAVNANPSGDFTVTVGDVSATVTPDPYVAATTTFTFSGQPNEGSLILINDASGGAAQFEFDDDNSGVRSGAIALTGITEAGGGATGSAADLVAKINGVTTLGITATNPSPGVVVLTQDTAGAAGNQPIGVNPRSHFDSVCSVNIPTAFTGGSDGSTSITAESLRTALAGSSFSSLITVVRGTESTSTTSGGPKNDHIVFVKSVAPGLVGNSLVLETDATDEEIFINDGVGGNLSGGTSIFPADGGTSTAIVNVYGTIISKEFSSDRGSLLSSGDPSMGRASTDGMIVFSDDQFTGSLQHFTKITVAWESLSANADITIVCSKI